MENERISSRQFSILVILFTVGSSILVQPTTLAVEAKQDAWLSAILGLVLLLLMVMLYDGLGSRFPQMTLVEYTELLLGKWLGKTVSLLLCATLLFTSWALLREIGDFFTTQIMPETPIQSIEILFLGIVIMAVRLGLEVFARAAELFFPWVIMLFLFLVAALLPDINFDNIHPILEGGMKPIWRGVIPILGSPSFQIFFFLILYPYVQRSSNGLRKSFITGTLIGGAILITVCLLTILVLGADLTARQVYPSLALAKKISVGRFLERLESFITSIWFLTIYFKLCVTFYGGLLSVAKTLKLKEYRFLSMPMGVIVLVFSLVSFPDQSYFAIVIRDVAPLLAATFGLVLPLVLLGVAFFRKNQLQGRKPADRYSKNKG